jgi:hypothetical protein
VKIPIRHFSCLAGLVVFLISLCVGGFTHAQNLLTDPGFESGTFVSNPIDGWAELSGAALSHDYTHSGSWSLKTAYNSSATIVMGRQTVPAMSGSTYAISGWGFTPTTLNGFQGFLLAAFSDSTQTLLESNGVLFNSIGVIDANTPAQTWTFLSGSVTAPANTAYITVFAELFNFNGPPGNVVYFDDLSLTQVPEPSCLAVLGAGLCAVLFRRRRNGVL